MPLQNVIRCTLREHINYMYLYRHGQRRVPSSSDVEAAGNVMTQIPANLRVLKTSLLSVSTELHFFCVCNRQSDL